MKRETGKPVKNPERYKWICLKCSTEYNEPTTRCFDCGCTYIGRVGVSLGGTREQMMELSNALFE